MVDGRRILIYGAAGGIGSALCRMLSHQGAQLHLVGRTESKLASLARELGATYTVGDVTDEALFTRVAQEAGRPLDGLVYAVGTITIRSLFRLTEADFLNDFRINALGAALAIQAALPALKESAGVASVVLFSSVAASQGFANHASIGMAKGAVSALTLALAAELAPKVRVNAIAPSLTRTPLGESLLGSEQMAASIAALHALQRLGEAKDIASLAAFLLSPQADWITGQIIGVDGGRSTLRTKG
ncbi:MAG: SDR family oxidoreductase [Anaerolineales bacterium]|nr:SDR family oxidoreductase [Anaerolineales bacterium]MCS7249231.1 SDR family oxidoreductase [Anaerolineales bacterium]MDW8163045.1 SDR family oxidoreductase [Anaerolineales bacterium]MDW8445669.1 SDR family oxidoreductase [Anaerolineales bacterium]